MSPKIPEFERQQLLKSLGYDFNHKRKWEKLPDPTFEPQSRLTFSALKEKGKWCFRQALLEIIFGEYQVSLDFPNEMPLANKMQMADFLENDLRKNLTWGLLYLKGNRETGIKKPLLGNVIETPEPYEFIRTFEQRCDKDILSPFRDWEARIQIAGFQIETEFSKQPLRKSIPASLALYLVIYKPDFPDWQPISDETIHIDKRVKILTIKQREIKLQEALFNLAVLLCESGENGLSSAEYEKFYQDLEDPNRTAPDFSKEVSRLNTALEKEMGLSLDRNNRVFKQTGGKNTPYRLNPQYKYYA